MLSSGILDPNEKRRAEITKRGPAAGCGHVFVLYCGIENFAADALLVPGEPGPEDVVRLKNPSPPNIKIYEAAGADSLHVATKITEAYLEAAGTALKGTKSGFKRAKPLAAMPLPGVGKMDSKDVIKNEGALIEVILPKIYDGAEKFEVDVALCIDDFDAYQVLQVSRESSCPFKSGPFWMLSDELKAHAARLQAQAEAHRLSLFFGAGVSFPSGLPSWGGLLEELAKKAGFNEDECKELAELGYLDQPTLIEEKMETGFKDAVADCVRAGRYTPAHALLAALELPAVTTNYDCLYESAAESCGEFVGRLPWDAMKLKSDCYDRSVLKMHGCVTHPESIVLTRKDYMRYADSLQSLRGRVHDLLLTTEVLFVGFSMTDENLHFIIDQNRKVLYKEGKPQGTMGTVLFLVENSMFRKLWDQDFRMVSCGSSWADAPAWRHDCFLDLLGCRVASKKARASFILNSKFECLLSEEERKLKDALQVVGELQENAQVTSTPSWNHVANMLDKLGFDSHKFRL